MMMMTVVVVVSIALLPVMNIAKLQWKIQELFMYIRQGGPTELNPGN